MGKKSNQYIVTINVLLGRVGACTKTCRESIKNVEEVREKCRNAFLHFRDAETEEQELEILRFFKKKLMPDLLAAANDLERDCNRLSDLNGEVLNSIEEFENYVNSKAKSLFKSKKSISASRDYINREKSNIRSTGHEISRMKEQVRSAKRYYKEFSKHGID